MDERLVIMTEKIIDKCFNDYVPHIVDLILDYDIRVVRKVKKSGRIVYGYTDRQNKRFILHCEDEPAVIDRDLKVYWLYGKLHRVDGPAIICPHLYVWYINGERIKSELRK